MNRRANERGELGLRVAANLREIRERRGLSRRDVIEALAKEGRGMPETSLLNTEAGSRRLDVDDLVALALVLGVTPNRLLLPEADPGEDIALTDETVLSFVEAWKWATGEAFPASLDGDHRHFRDESRPHEEELSMDVVDELTDDQWAAIARVADAISEVTADSPLAWDDVAQVARISARLRPIGQQAREIREGRDDG